MSSIFSWKATMKSVVFASILASAAAFAPAQQSRASTSLNEFCRGYVGGESVEPMFIGATGSKNFDPAGLAEVSASNLCTSLCNEVPHTFRTESAGVGPLVP